MDIKQLDYWHSRLRYLTDMRAQVKEALYKRGLAFYGVPSHLFDFQDWGEQKILDELDAKIDEFTELVRPYCRDFYALVGEDIHNAYRAHLKDKLDYQTKMQHIPNDFMIQDKTYRVLLPPPHALFPNIVDDFPEFGMPFVKVIDVPLQWFGDSAVWWRLGYVEEIDTVFVGTMVRKGDW